MQTILNYETFQEAIKQDIMIVIAKTKTCTVCRPLTQKLDQFMDNYPMIPAFEVYLEDVAMFQGQHLVFTVPTILVFSQGQEILRESRFINFEKIERLFNMYLA